MCKSYVAGELLRVGRGQGELTCGRNLQAEGGLGVGEAKVGGREGEESEVAAASGTGQDTLETLGAGTKELRMVGRSGGRMRREEARGSAWSWRASQAIVTRLGFLFLRFRF